MNDPYVYENGVLKNKLGIKSYEELNRAEADIGFIKLVNVDSVDVDYFDENLLKRIHKHIFGEIFDWAGEFRTVPVIKQEQVGIPGLTLQYAKPQDIEKKLTAYFKSLNEIDWQNIPLDKKIPLFTSKLVELWSIHPFRDGNTRTTITFANNFAKEHGFPMDLNMLLERLPRQYVGNRAVRYSVRDTFVLAAIPKEHYPEPEHLTTLIRSSIVSGMKKNINALQSQLDDIER